MLLICLLSVLIFAKLWFVTILDMPAGAPLLREKASVQPFAGEKAMLGNYNLVYRKFPIYYSIFTMLFFYFTDFAKGNSIRFKPSRLLLRKRALR